MTKTVWNSLGARLVAAILAVLLIVFAWMQFCALGQDDLQKTSNVKTAKDLLALSVSDAQAKCVTDRHAQIDQMVEDGFLAKEESKKAKVNATNLCIAR